jgi:hypothetical protein
MERSTRLFKSALLKMDQESVAQISIHAFENGGPFLTGIQTRHENPKQHFNSPVAHLFDPVGQGAELGAVEISEFDKALGFIHERLRPVGRTITQ